MLDRCLQPNVLGHLAFEVNLGHLCKVTANGDEITVVALLVDERFHGGMCKERDRLKITEKEANASL